MQSEFPIDTTDRDVIGFTTDNHKDVREAGCRKSPLTTQISISFFANCKSPMAYITMRPISRIEGGRPRQPCH